MGIIDGACLLFWNIILRESVNCIIKGCRIVESIFLPSIVIKIHFEIDIIGFFYIDNVTKAQALMDRTVDMLKAGNGSLLIRNLNDKLGEKAEHQLEQIPYVR